MLPKAIDTFNDPHQHSQKLNTVILYFIWKHQRAIIAKTIVKHKNTA